MWLSNMQLGCFETNEEVLSQLVSPCVTNVCVSALRASPFLRAWMALPTQSDCVVVLFLFANMAFPKQVTLLSTREPDRGGLDWCPLVSSMPTWTGGVVSVKLMKKSTSMVETKMEATPHDKRPPAERCAGKDLGRELNHRSMRAH